MQVRVTCNSFFEVSSYPQPLNLDRALTVCTALLELCAYASGRMRKAGLRLSHSWQKSVEMHLNCLTYVRKPARQGTIVVSRLRIRPEGSVVQKRCSSGRLINMRTEHMPYECIYFSG